MSGCSAGEAAGRVANPASNVSVLMTNRKGTTGNNGRETTSCLRPKTCHGENALWMKIKRIHLRTQMIKGSKHSNDPLKKSVVGRYTNTFFFSISCSKTTPHKQDNTDSYAEYHRFFPPWPMVRWPPFSTWTHERDLPSKTHR